MDKCLLDPKRADDRRFRFETRDADRQGSPGPRLREAMCSPRPRKERPPQALVDNPVWSVEDRRKGVHRLLAALWTGSATNRIYPL